MVSLRRIVPILALAAAGLALAACGGGGKKTEATEASSTSGTSTVAPPPTAPPAPTGKPAVTPAERKPLAPAKTYAVLVKTNYGSFTITLDQKTSPHVTAA